MKAIIRSTMLIAVLFASALPVKACEKSEANKKAALDFMQPERLMSTGL